MSDIKEKIAKKVAGFFKPGDVVNLGIGIPTMVGNYIQDGVWLHTENGLVGYGPAPEKGQESEFLTGAGAQFITAYPGAAAFDSATSFAIVRGGHLTATVLGAMEVDEKGNLANWSRPGVIVGMGGAMDLVNGAKDVIIAMEHTAKGGKHKILESCSLPLTGVGVVTKIVTELCVIQVTEEGLVLQELTEGVTLEEVLEKTGANLIVSEALR
ncbi:3-oxoacid CoA-transferase subunit B [Anoxybacterium hadale]|uniref:3-oxoacid CoA-transferase subunit B n=1 Tax=Anoxybacterium hadale TaxID=3408580 RepID=A0ACD1AE78_9FIRM|nr:3-oxoacid CoA-transferase subunit B [Clostridiales bacterium]